MDAFDYRNGSLYAEDVPVADIVHTHGSPCYIYSRATLERHWHAFDAALAGRPHRVCYAVKANSNLALLNCLARLGSGFDIVSGGELARVLAAGGDPAKVVFSGVAKTAAEMRQALEAGIHCFNVESLSELERLAEVAADVDIPAPVSLRVNPDVDAGTHPYISTGLKENKFGIDIGEAEAIYRDIGGHRHLRVIGIDCHIGSQLTRTEPFIDALRRVLALVDRLAADGIVLEHLDLGGGLGIRYRDETPPEPAEYVAPLLAELGDRALEILIEPGRAIAGNAGILVTRVEYLKRTEAHNFAIVDAGMNDLIRPSLYSAWQEIIPVRPRQDTESRCYDIVGPVCETGDFLGKARELALTAGDLLAVRSAGAYGFTMSSNYNSRPRPPEIMVDNDRIHLIRPRETIEDLYRGETLLPED
ncbi:diaminopimelate decarboxylase [Thiohalobacter sp. COW1]|uniref:diaminopimelate decarboxylase n=1 Tax=Thiohalobacter sp. COW1 TaxID=2795687 RepID=UPI0019167C6E|nr:diaminopimelate decarboxylase [Thiohalobacter sp. COW1]BCO32329.1 diaminopimelate decarboxylase [Thiohalobacter sp. COW1]